MKSAVFLLVSIISSRRLFSCRPVNPDTVVIADPPAVAAAPTSPIASSAIALAGVEGRRKGSSYRAVQGCSRWEYCHWHVV
ncbi:hypothetical protein FB451DRAFT_1265710 [Mycena latifolia]|nr:hypothetical protein FB451DRAFT_1265710 [Mycena latifolia]